MARGRGDADLGSGLQLLASHAFIPFKELFERAAVIKMIEKSLRGDAGSFEHQRPAHHFLVLRENLIRARTTVHAATLNRPASAVNVGLFVAAKCNC